MDWNADWDDTVGLWQKPGPGHVASTKKLKIVHAGPDAAGKLLAAVRLNVLHEIDSEKVLRALRDLQWKKKDDYCFGCMKWYSEENDIGDSNAAFFIGMKLIILRIRYYERLTPVGQQLLDEILPGLNVWFRNTIRNAEIYYPNKYLGDLVCKWLLMELLGKSEEDDFVIDMMYKAAHDWQNHHWGWGEHLSDGYSNVCLGELSVLLLMSKQLPEDLRRVYQDLTNELLDIEDAFGDAPRVPTLRSYAFLEPKPHKNFRDSIAPENEVLYSSGMIDLGPILHECGWHEAMPPRKKQPRNIHIPCYGGNMANAHMEDDIRLGSMSHFPIMPSADHPTWGLSWQCFPAVMSRGMTDWGFLQWETLEGGKLRAHPANGGPFAHIPKTLSDAIMPPVTGETFSLQRGSDVLIFRIMRCIPQSLEMITDRFRLLATTADVEESCQDDWHQLLLHYPGRDVSVNFISLTPCDKTELVRAENDRSDWDHTLTNASPAFHDQRILLHLWAISLNGKIETPPEITVENRDYEVRMPGEKVRLIDWKWKNTHWKVKIDPLQTDIIQEIPDR